MFFADFLISRNISGFIACLTDFGVILALALVCILRKLYTAIDDFSSPYPSLILSGSMYMVKVRT